MLEWYRAFGSMEEVMGDTEAVVRAPADGSTLLVSVNTLVMNRSLYPQAPFDPLRDLTPVGLTSWGQLMLVTHPKAGFKTAGDLVDAARRAPGPAGLRAGVQRLTARAECLSTTTG